MIERETIERLRVKLTTEEMITRAETLARHMAETDRLQEEFASLRKFHTERVKEREAEARARAQDIALGTEEREVMCFEVPRFADRLVDVVRADTHEVVRTRALQPDERQAELFEEPQPAPERALKPTKH